MLDFIRLDTGQTLVGLSIYRDRGLYPLCAGNAVQVDAQRLGVRYASPVNVVTYPANDDVEQPTTAVLH